MMASGTVPVGTMSFIHVCRNGSTAVCIHMFRCRKSNQCLQLGNVCDGQTNCPAGDDEFMCQFKDTECPHGCKCMALAMECKSTPIESLESQAFPHVSASFTQLSSVFFKLFCTNFPEIMFVSVLASNLSNGCSEHIPQKLIFIDLGFNCIQVIKQHCFQVSTLRTVMLDSNCITLVESHSFFAHVNLKFVNLSNNPLHYLQAEFVVYSSHMSVIIIRNISLRNIALDAFHNVNVDIIDTTDFHICCVAPPRSICTENIPWYRSCLDLLSDRKMVICFMVVASNILFLNVASMLLNILQHKLKIIKPGFSATVFAININDLLCALYLSIIWIAHLQTKGRFKLMEQAWRSGAACFTASNIVIWFTLQTQLLHIFLSLSRLRVVTHPVETLFKNTEFIVKCLGNIGVGTFCCGLFVSFLVKFTTGALPLNLCLPLVDPTNSTMVIKIVTLCVVSSQTLSIFAILVQHVLLVFELKKSQKEISKAKSDGTSNTVLVAQLVGVTASNFICWFPANAVFLSAMLLSQYPTDIITWTVVGILPLNSVVYPCVFCLTAVRKIVKHKMKNTPSSCKSKHLQENHV